MDTFAQVTPIFPMLCVLVGQEEKGTTEDEMAGWLDDLMDVSLSELRTLVMDREAWRTAIHGVAKGQTWLSDWTELNWTDGYSTFSFSRNLHTIYIPPTI